MIAAGRFACCPSVAILAQAAHDVFDVDDRVVDDGAHGDDESRQHHRIERCARRK